MQLAAGEALCLTGAGAAVMASPVPMSLAKGSWVASRSICITWAADELRIAQSRKTLEEGETIRGVAIGGGVEEGAGLAMDCCGRSSVG
jgi:hypothetical protein